MKAKQFSVLLATFLLLTLLLGACGGENEIPPSGDSPEPQAEGSPPSWEPPACLETCASITAENIGDLQQVATFNRGRITDIATSPDNSMLAVAVGVGVYIYDTQTLRALAYIYDGTLMQSVAFSPDGKDLAVGSYTQVYLYAITTTNPSLSLEKRLTITGPFSVVQDLVYSPDGLTLGAACDNRRGFLIDVSTAEYLWLEHQSTLFNLAYSSSGDQVSTSSSQTMNIWDAASGDMLQTVAIDTCDWAVYLAALPGDHANIIGCENQLRIVEGDTTINASPADVAEAADARSLLGNPTANQEFAVGRTDGSVEVWNATDLSAARWSATEGHSLSVISLAYLPDGSALFSASNTEVKKWNASTGKELGTIDGFSPFMSNFLFLSDASMLYTAQNTIWQRSSDACYGQLSPSTELRTLPEHFYSSWFSSDGSLLPGVVSQGEETSVQILNVRDGLRAEIPVTGDYSPHYVFLSPDKEVLAVLLGEEIVFYNMEGQEIARLKEHEYYVTTMAFSPDGSRFISVGGDGKILVWDASTFSLLETLTGSMDYVYAIAFSPDGRYLAIGYSNGTVTLWDLSTFSLLYTLTGHTKYIEAILFTPDNKIMITSATDRTIKFWDTATGEEIAWLTLPGYAIEMAFSPDGKLLSIVTGDGVVRMFGIPCEAQPPSVDYPKVTIGKLPLPPPEPVSPACSVVILPPAGEKIVYGVTEGLHAFSFPAGVTPNPKTTILWSNMKRATESGGHITLYIVESRATVVYDEAAGSVSVQIPNCNPPPPPSCSWNTPGVTFELVSYNNAPGWSDCGQASAFHSMVGDQAIASGSTVTSSGNECSMKIICPSP